MKKSDLKRKIGGALLLMYAATIPLFSSPAMAKNADDIDTIIEEHENLLQTLKTKRTEQKVQEKKQAELEKTIKSLQEQLSVLKNSQSELGKTREENEQAQRTIQALNEQIATMKKQLEEQTEQSNRLMKLIESLENAEKERKAQEEARQKLAKEKQEEARQQRKSAVRGAYEEAPDYGSGVLVNPGPVGNLNYTQDAQNAQGKSTVTFAYAPNQMYKIYCRVGFLTDIVLKKGEKVSFVGGGDTASWALDSSTIDGATHIYIKPTVDTSATNLIINTNKRSYHILLNTSESYNPMVRWSYGQEDKLEVMQKQEADEKAITSSVNGNLDSLNFNYSINGPSNLKPEMVFDDGEKTFVRFKSNSSRIPTLFIKEMGKKEASLANYKIKDKTYIIDRLVKEIELRFSEDETVKIKRKN